MAEELAEWLVHILVDQETGWFQRQCNHQGLPSATCFYQLGPSPKDRTTSSQLGTKLVYEPCPVLALPSILRDLCEPFISPAALLSNKSEIK